MSGKQSELMYRDLHGWCSCEFAFEEVCIVCASTVCGDMSQCAHVVMCGQHPVSVVARTDGKESDS